MNVCLLSNLIPYDGNRAWDDFDHVSCCIIFPTTLFSCLAPCLWMGHSWCQLPGRRYVGELPRAARHLNPLQRASMHWTKSTATTNLSSYKTRCNLRAANFVRPPSRPNRHPPRWCDQDTCRDAWNVQWVQLAGLWFSANLPLRARMVPNQEMTDFTLDHVCLGPSCAQEKQTARGINGVSNVRVSFPGLCVSGAQVPSACLNAPVQTTSHPSKTKNLRFNFAAGTSVLSPLAENVLGSIQRGPCPH